MTQEERRVWLIEQLYKEDSRYEKLGIPSDTQQQKDLLRSLMNMRGPEKISSEFLQIQDEYLTEENGKDGYTDVDDLEPSAYDSRMYLWQGDITTLKVDAIVNAANSQMCGCFRPLHNCVDNIIHSKSGIQLRLKCSDMMKAQGYEEPAGRAKITPAYNLPCKYILHTVGPIVQGRVTEEHCNLLKSCYRSCLELAEQNGVETIAFCCISTGVFMFPNDLAAEFAIKAVKEYLDGHSGIKKVVFNVFKDEDMRLYTSFLAD
jgi:O-acetyl-ADP-ribose deacetylase (regulator of RNase III)